MKKEYKIDDNLKNYFTKEKYNFYMGKIIKSFIHPGDYYTYQRAETIIDNCSIKEKDKEEIKKFIKYVAKSRSLTVAKESYSEYKYMKILGQLKELNINPITIPKNDMPSYIKNPVTDMLS